jgi:uncharacterized protein YaiL (DUF2058 family)
MLKSQKTISSGRAGLLALTLASSMLLGACASTPPPPTDALQAAELAINRAEEAQSATAAPLEMKRAREKLTAARAAVNSEDPIKARRLAEQARADAEFAQAKAEEAGAAEINTELERSIRLLQEESTRPRI